MGVGGTLCNKGLPGVDIGFVEKGAAIFGCPVRSRRISKRGCCFGGIRPFWGLNMLEGMITRLLNLLVYLDGGDIL